MFIDNINEVINKQIDMFIDNINEVINKQTDWHVYR